MKESNLSDQFDPLTFQGLIGRSIAQHTYSLLFREDGSPRAKSDIMSDPALTETVKGLNG